LISGRKLLLADDSITIQKVVALTFADEGIQVLAVSNGADAIERLEEFSPDIVLADVYMPEVTGLEVCDYIKRNEKLKHIPVMLLVGSFEPFDEGEARRVGADDILSKPFQSIRNLVDKVAVLLGRAPVADTFEQGATEQPTSVAAEQPQSVSELDFAKTLDLPYPEKVVAEETPEPMDTGELEMTTADTRPLSPEIRDHLEKAAKEDRAIEPVEDEKMETQLANQSGPEISEGFDEALLELGEFEAVPAIASDDMILDIDFDSPAPEIPSAAPPSNGRSAVALEAHAVAPAVIEHDVPSAPVPEEVGEWEVDTETVELEVPFAAAPDFEGEVDHELLANKPGVEAVHESQEPEQWSKPEVRPEPASDEVSAVQASVTGQIQLDQLSPEVIDAIARRAVEQISEKVVQEIAWEVVPQLADLLIKRRLAEKESQTN